LASDLTSISRNDSLPEIVRATALEYLSASQETSGVSVVAEKLHDRDPLLRFTAVRHTAASDAADLLTNLVPLLDDSVRAVRIEAAARLSSLKREQFTETEYRAYISSAKEYEAALAYGADFPTGRFNLGKYYEGLGDARLAEENYREAIAIDDLFYPAKVNLAFLYYNEHQLARAESLFIDVSRKHPEYPDADYNLGLLYAEQGRDKDAVKRLEFAVAKHGGTNAYYNLALAYQRVNDFGKSESSLIKILSREPGDYRTLYALCDLYVKMKSYVKAEKYADELRKRYPEDQDAQKIFSYIRGQRPH
jgi:tetratricopeptide (TPR) repeat protein